MKNGKYSVMIVEDQQMPKTLFSHYINSSKNFYLQIAIENASIADFDTLIFCILRQVIDLSFRALSITNTGDTSVYYSCCHLYQRLN